MAKELISVRHFCELYNGDSKSVVLLIKEGNEVDMFEIDDAYMTVYDNYKVINWTLSFDKRADIIIYI